jgi:hypothetical protein
VSLAQQKVGNLHGDGGQFDDLMGVGQRGGGTLSLAPGTRRWIDVLHGSRFKQGDSRAWMARARPRLPAVVRRVQTTSQDPLHQCEVRLIVSYDATPLISVLREL